MNNQIVRICNEVMAQVRKPLRIRKVTLSNLSPRDQLRFSWAYSIPKSSYQDNISKEVTAVSFNIPSISLVTNDRITQSYMVTTVRVVK